MSGHAGDLNDVLAVGPELLTDADAVVSTLADPATNLDDLLVTANSLVTQFEGQNQTIESLMVSSTETLEAINVDDSAPLRVTISRLPETLRTAKAGLKAINPPLLRPAGAVEELAPGVDRLVAAVPDLRGFMTESPPVARPVKEFTSDAEEPLRKRVRSEEGRVGKGGCRTVKS